MPLISLVLIVKIAVTGLMAGLPFLLLSAEKLAKLTGVEGATNVFRLYGTAIIALLVGYASGFPQIAQGHFPWGVVAMGLVSNGGQAAFLFGSGAWQRQRFMAFFLAGITLALILCCLNPEAVIKPLW